MVSDIIDVPQENKVLTVGNGQTCIICGKKFIESSFSKLKE